MARQKKNIIPEPIKEPENNTSKISYSGKVTVTIRRGNTPIATKVFKNSGNKPLFKFFCQCLAGNYKEGEIFRPTKIKLFYNSTADINEAKKRPMENITAKSGFMTQTSNPVVDASADGASCSTTFHFLIPNAYIYNTEGNQINQICLYNTRAVNDVSTEDCLAYFLMSNEDNDEWATITPSGNDFNLIVDWEMILQNGGK